jgi:hypothetical protein
MSLGVRLLQLSLLHLRELWQCGLSPVYFKLHRGSNPTRGVDVCRFSLCYAVLCKYRPCDELIPHPWSPINHLYMDSQFQNLILNWYRPQDVIREMFNQQLHELLKFT